MEVVTYKGAYLNMSYNNLADTTLVKKKHVDLDPINKRIKVYEMPDEIEQFMEELDDLAVEMNCDKIIFYVKSGSNEETLIQDILFHTLNYEGEIEGFFKGETTRVYAKYLNPARNNKSEENVISIVKNMDFSLKNRNNKLPDGYTIRWATEEDADEMAELYNAIFSKYPTPINEPTYIAKLMKNEVYFSLIFHDDELVSACSADILMDYNAAEFTDCATRPSHRGKGLLSYQYPFLEGKMKECGVHTMFSYTRAISMGMNIIVAQHGFTYGGCMIQNSWIGNGLEDMNIWYKVL